MKQPFGIKLEMKLICKRIVQFYHNYNGGAQMKLLVIIAAAYAIIFGMTTYIDFLHQISAAMYSAGHDVGSFLKDLFN